MRSRRAIASVVGMVFAIIALTTTITYISYSMGILNNFNQSVLVQNQQLTDVNKEKFQISSATVPNGKFNITLTDTGALPIQFTKVWIQDTTPGVIDQVSSYVPTHNFVSPGGVLTNMGQNMLAINSAHSYNVKLVTSRGNTQQFTMNSIDSAKLNVQFYAFPSTLPSGFSSQIVMVVTNNSTGTLVNLTPSASASPSSPTCVLGSASPPTYNSLQPGGTAVFSWTLTATGNANTVCTVTGQLQNGQTASTTVTIEPVQLSSTTYAQNAGLLTITYTSFQWIQNSTWNNGWAIPGGNGKTNTGFAIQITNNNVTKSNVSLYLSKQSQILLYDPKDSGNPHQFYITEGITPGSNSFSISAYTCNGDNDYCVNIPSGQTATLYFASGSPQSPSGASMIKPGDDGIAFIVLFGKYSTSQNSAGNMYGQNLPFIGVMGT